MKETVFCGDDLIEISLPDDASVIYPPPPVTPGNPPEELIEKALNNPLDCKPLEELVKPYHKITVAFDDPCLPLPPMKIDPRGVIAEKLVKKLLRAGVKKENIRFICANGLHRKWTERELRAIIGNRIPDEFKYNEQLFCHDAEDRKNLVFLGNTESGERVEINRAVIDSDITFYINLNWTSMNGGWKSIAVGLGSYDSIKFHHSPEVLLKSALLDPPLSEMHLSIDRIGRIIKKFANVFQIECVINNDIWDGWPGEHFDLSETPSRLMKFAKYIPYSAKRIFRSFLRSNYKLIGVNAGDVDSVHSRTLELVSGQQNVKIETQYDVAVIGLPNLSPYSAFSEINPVLVMNLALGYIFNFFSKKPFIKEGGVLIILNPCRKIFHRIHHLPYIEFFEKVLSETRDPLEMRRIFEESFARNPDYISAYRFRFSYHGAHPFFVWYWGAKGLKHLGRVIIAYARDYTTVRKMGFIPAKNFDEAIDYSREICGNNFSIALLKMPPIFILVSGA